MSIEKVCGNCEYFKAYSNQPAKMLIGEAGRKGVCMSPMVAVEETFEEWTPDTAVDLGYYTSDIPFWVHLDETCFKSTKDSETALFLLLDSY